MTAFLKLKISIDVTTKAPGAISITFSNTLEMIS